MTAKNAKINDLDIAFETTMDAIVTQALAPGQKVSESVFSEQFGISRSISRNLIERLISKQFLVDVSPRITQVAPLTLLDIKQNFMLRKLLIPHTFAIASANVDFEELHLLHERVNSFISIENDNAALQVLKANKDLNLAICKNSGYPLMIDWAQQLEDMAMRVYWLYIKTTAQFPYSKDQQLKVFDVVKSKEPAAIEKTVLEMLSQTEDRILNAVISNKRFCTQNLLTS